MKASVMRLAALESPARRVSALGLFLTLPPEPQCSSSESRAPTSGRLPNII